jgi:hypothetical protein
MSGPIQLSRFRRSSVWRHRIEGAVWGIVSAGALAFFIVGSVM